MQQGFDPVQQEQFNKVQQESVQRGFDQVQPESVHMYERWKKRYSKRNPAIQFQLINNNKRILFLHPHNSFW